MAGVRPWSRRPPTIPVVDPHALPVAEAASAVASTVIDLYDAWTRLDPLPSRALLNPALWRYHVAQMELYRSQGLRNQVDAPRILEVTTLAAVLDADATTVRCRVRMEGTNCDVDASGMVVRGSPGRITWCQDWIVRRDEAEPAAIRCTTCDAAAPGYGRGLCGHCGTVLPDQHAEWRVTAFGTPDITQTPQEPMQRILRCATIVPADGDGSMRTVTEDLPVHDDGGSLASADEDFDDATVVAAVRLVVLAVWRSWMTMDVSTLRPMLSGDALSAVSADLERLRRQGVSYAVDVPLFDDAAIIDLAQGTDCDSLTVRAGFAAQVRIDSHDGRRPQDAGQPSHWMDITISRAAESFRTARHCTTCGAPLRTVFGACAYCRAPVADAAPGWMVTALGRIENGSVQLLNPVLASAAEQARVDAELQDMRRMDEEEIRRFEAGYKGSV